MVSTAKNITTYYTLNTVVQNMFIQADQVTNAPRFIRYCCWYPLPVKVCMFVSASDGRSGHVVNEQDKLLQYRGH